MTPGLVARLRLFHRGSSETRRSATGHSRRRGARAAITSGAVAFLTATVGLAIAVEIVMPEWRDPEFGHRLTRLRRSERESPGRPLVVAIGTSRTQNGICPRAMGLSDEPGSPRLLNFGHTAGTPIKELLTLRRLLDGGMRPDAVVVELFPPNLMGTGPAERQFAGQEVTLSRADVERLATYWGDADAVRAAWRKARANPWFAQRQVLMNHWLPRWQPWSGRFDHQWTSLDADGFQPVGEVPAATRARAWAHARREYAAAFDAFRVGEPSARAVREMVRACRDRGIRVAFFLPPVSPAFRAEFAPGVFSQGEAAALDLARQLNVPVFPAPRDLAEGEFLDGHHLLRGGAERYSRWLADNYLRPWLAKSGMGGAP
jgi:hypothetical protein